MKRIEFWKMSDSSCLNGQVKMMRDGFKLFSISITDIEELHHLVQFLDYWLSESSISGMWHPNNFWSLYPYIRIFDQDEKKVHIEFKALPNGEIKLNFETSEVKDLRLNQKNVSLSLSEAEELLKFLSERVKVKKRDL